MLFNEKGKREKYIDGSKAHGEALDKIISEINISSFSEKEKQDFYGFRDNWKKYEKDGNDLIDGVVTANKDLEMKARTAAVDDYNKAYE